MSGEGIRVEVVRVDQSPMNPKEWCLELSCGHEVWITAASRPIRKHATCTHATHSEEAS
jgi:hypothetical protein